MKSRRVSWLVFLVIIPIILIGIPTVWAETRQWNEEGVYFPEPVVLVHGINSTAASWNASIPTLRKFFKHYWKGNQSDKPNTYIEAFNYGGEFGEESFQPVKDSGDKLGRFIKDVRSRYENKQVMLVCHSLGGLVGKYYLSTFGDYSRRRSQPLPVRRFITLGTPHTGTGFANIGTSVVNPRMLPGLQGYVTVANYLLGPLERKMTGGSFLGRFVTYGRKYGREGSMYALRRNAKRPWDKLTLPVSEAVLVYFPDDEFVSVSSQRADGLDSLAFVRRIPGPPGVGHMQETSQHEVIMKALDGIKTFASNPDFADDWSDKPVVGYELMFKKSVRLRFQEYESHRYHWEMLEKENDLGMESLDENLEDIGWDGVEKGIQRFFLSSNGKMNLRLTGMILPRNRQRNEYLPASTPGGINGTKVRVAMKRYASAKDASWVFPPDPETEWSLFVEEAMEHGASAPIVGKFSWDAEITNDEERPYVVFFVEAENPGGLKSDLKRYALRTLPSIVSLIRAINERQELYEGATLPYYGGPVYKLRQTEYATKVGVAGEPDGGKDYPPEDALDGIWVDTDVCNLLRYDVAQLLSWFYDAQGSRDAPGEIPRLNLQKILNHPAGGKYKDGYWTQIPEGRPNGPSYGRYLRKWDDAIYPVHIEEIRKVVDAMEWILLQRVDSQFQIAAVQEGSGVERLKYEDYPAFRDQVFSKWRQMQPALASDPKYNYPVAGVRMYAIGLSDSWIRTELERSRAAFWFKAPELEEKKVVAGGMLVARQGPYGNISDPIRVFEMGSWPGSYDTEGRLLATLTSAKTFPGEPLSVHLPLTEYGDYFLKFAASNQVESTNYLPEGKLGILHQGQWRYEAVTRSIQWVGKEIWVLLKLKFGNPKEKLVGS